MRDVRAVGVVTGIPALGEVSKPFETFGQYWAGSGDPRRTRPDHAPAEQRISCDKLTR